MKSSKYNTLQVSKNNRSASQNQQMIQSSLRTNHNSNRNLNPKKNQSYQAKSVANFPSLSEQSTNITSLKKEEMIISQFEKRVPKRILPELQNDPSFFSSLKQDSINNKRRLNNEQLNLNQQKNKKKDNIDVIINGVGKAIEKLKPYTKQDKQKNQFSDSDSDFDDLMKQKIKKSRSTRFQNNYKKTGFGNLPDPDKELQTMSQKLQNEQNKLNMNKEYKNRSHQISSIQQTLADGQQKLNLITREKEKKQQKLKQLLVLIEDINNEIIKMSENQHIISGSNSELVQKIEYNLNLLESQKQYRETLKNMKQNKRFDLDMIKKRCDILKNMNKEFDVYLKGETQILLKNEAEITQIRKQYYKTIMEKEKTDHRLDLALKEHELHMKQDQEVFQIIQLEQAAYDEFDNLKKEEKQQIKNQKKMESKQIQEQIMQQQDLLQDLQQELHKLTSQLNGVQNVNELIPQLEDLQQTNKYCIEQKDSLVQEKEQMRQLIIKEEQELYKVKCEALNIPENDQLIQNYQETTLIDTFKKKQKLIQETKELKEKEQYIQSIMNKSDRIIKDLVNTLSKLKLPELNSKNLELKNTNDVSIQLINGITGLMNGLEQNHINEDQIENILLNKYKEHDQPEDSFQGLKDIEQPQSDSSYDFGNSQVEIIS